MSADEVWVVSVAQHEHVWTPVGLQDIDVQDYTTRTTTPGSVLVPLPDYRRYIVHACACGDWRLIPMDGDVLSRVVHTLT